MHLTPTKQSGTRYEPSPKDKSPIRQSLRNLLSVFKKANSRERVKSDGEDDQKDGPNLTATHLALSRRPLSLLLYLSRDRPTTLLPVWLACAATLQNGVIELRGLTRHEEPIHHFINLSHCSDIRSVSSQQLDPQEATTLLLASGKHEYKVFEIRFEGKAQETFAAPSLQERASWISAIWDFVLPPPDSHSIRNYELRIRNTDVQTASSCNNSYSQFAVSPIPQLQDASQSTFKFDKKTYPRQSVLDPLRDPVSVHAQSRPLPEISHPRSLSIESLSQRSLVQQRLAQTESNSSLESGSGSPRSPATLSGSRHILTKLSFEPGRASPTTDPEATQRLDVAALDMILSPNTGGTPRLPYLGSPDLCQSPQSPTQMRLDSAIGQIKTLLYDQEERNRDRTLTLGDQFISLQSEVQRLPRDLKSGLQADFGMLQGILSQLAEWMVENREALMALHKQVQDHNLQHKRDAENAIDTTKEIRLIQERLTVLHDGHPDKTASPAVLQNVGSPSEVSSRVPLLDSPEFVVKLDEILLAIRTPRDTPTLEGSVERVLSTLEEDRSQRILQIQQQADSVRYLHELNQWLETFVNNETSHIQELSTGVGYLCRDLGSAEDGMSALAVIRQLAADMTERGHDSATVQASLDELCQTVKGHFAMNNADSIAELLDRQRQVHEELVRALTKDICDEIRGERLRFVDAMKEATAINVQIHVEQFKEELKREVREMTEEVGRLHQARQAIQTQIADLFSFYTKQRAVEEIESVNVVQTSVISQSTQHRPLPQPAGP